MNAFDTDIPTRALIVRPPYADLIVRGEKTWEMRTRPCKLRGPIAIAEGGNKRIIGVAVLTGSGEPIDADRMKDSLELHRIEPELQRDAISGGWRYPWILSDAIAFETPIPFVSRDGAVIWAKLDETTRHSISRALIAHNWQKRHHPAG